MDLSLPDAIIVLANEAVVTTGAETTGAETTGAETTGGTEQETMIHAKSLITIIEVASTILTS
ncbi:hypothetical protein K3495_g17243 [Podosphaera aphanis]|nr:hypothetical protein K3495_g17243 [Podosphaera aphanis]